MNLDLSDEQRMFRDIVDRFFAERSRLHASSAKTADLWPEMAGLGLLALPFGEQHGGGGQVESMLVHRAVGRTVCDAGYLGSITLAGGLLNLIGGDVVGRLAPAMSSGRARLAFAHREHGGRQRCDAVATCAEQVSGQWRLTGRKFHALDAQFADQLIVSARIGGASNGEGRPGLFLVDAKGPGISARHHMRHDGSSVSDLTFDGILLDEGAELMPDQDAAGVIEHALDLADAALVAQAAGTMEAMLDLTIAHLGTRRQFGRALRDFQALQHRTADMFAELQLTLAMSTYASLSAATPDAPARRRSLLAAKAQASQSGRFIGQQSIQLHGGMGMTAEHPIGKLFKRMTVLEMEMGTAEENLSLLAAAGGLFTAEPDPLPEFDLAFGTN